MARAFADITFTESVKAAQSLYGSREFNQRFELSPEKRDQLTEMDEEFITGRDSFYQASLGENGWPYMQHRGGPKGFIKVLDTKTLAYADYRGNRQYISVGNLMADNRVTLFLMDYANHRRLKIWGRVEFVHEKENAEFIAALKAKDDSTIVERALLIHIEALEWNCSKHITPRFTETEIKSAIAPLIEENNLLRARLAELELLLGGNKRD